MILWSLVIIYFWRSWFALRRIACRARGISSCASSLPPLQLRRWSHVKCRRSFVIRLPGVTCSSALTVRLERVSSPAGRAAVSPAVLLCRSRTGPSPANLGTSSWVVTDFRADSDARRDHTFETRFSIDRDQDWDQNFDLETDRRRTLRLETKILMSRQTSLLPDPLQEHQRHRRVVHWSILCDPTQPNTNCHWLTLSLYYSFWSVSGTCQINRKI